MNKDEEILFGYFYLSINYNLVRGKKVTESKRQLKMMNLKIKSKQPLASLRPTRRDSSIPARINRVSEERNGDRFRWLGSYAFCECHWCMDTIGLPKVKRPR